MRDPTARWCRHLLLLTCALGWQVPARADTLTGEVRGTVLDVDGLVALPGVAVTLTNVDREWTRQTASDSSGNFVFLQLEPGNYTVQVEAAGYYPQKRTGILIRLNQPRVVIPPFQLRKEVSTPTRQVILQGEQTRTAVIDLSAPGPNPVVLAYVSEPGQTSLLSTRDVALRSSYGERTLEAIPLRGTRSFDQLALLSPGVFRVPLASGSGPAVGIGVGTAGQFSVNGMRGRSNNFTVDGSDNNDEDIGVRRQGFVALVPQSLESVQEFEITTAGFNAEFGRNVGSMTNVVSRSGTSRWHGNAYGLFSHHALRARDSFQVPFRDSINKGALSGGSYDGDDSWQRLIGGTVGGPLVSDRLFLFTSLELQRERENRVGHFVVPHPEERGLRTTSGFVPVEELTQFFEDRGFLYSGLAGEGVFSLYPLPNQDQGPFGSHTYSQVRKSEKNGRIFSVKGDWYLSDVHSFSGRYNLTDDDSILPFTSEALNSSLATETRTQNASLFLNSTAAGLANALRVSYGRTSLGFPPELGSPLIFGSTPIDAETSGIDVPALERVIETPYGSFGPFGVTGPIGQLSIAPYSTIGVDVFNFPQGRVDNTFQVSDFVTLVRGAHQVKTGFDFRWTQLNSFSDRNARPLLFFGHGFVSDSCVGNPTCLFGFEDGVLRASDLAALGSPAGLLHTIATPPIPDSTIGLRLAQYDFFVQDHWQLRPNLNISLGLRYELQTAPREQNGRIEETFDLTPEEFGHLPPPNSPSNQAFDSALLALGDVMGGRERIYQPDRDNFAPRIGIAWDPWSNHRMVLRAGYGISYNAVLGAVASQSRNVFPTFVPVNLNPNFLNFDPLTGQFNPLAGRLVPSTTFLTFLPTGEPLITPGTINSFNISEDAFATAVGALIGQGSINLSEGGVVRINGLAFTLPEFRLESPSAQHFVLSLQQQFRQNWLVSVDYVSTRGSHLTRFTTPNLGLITTPAYLFIPSLARIPIVDVPPVRPDSDLGAYTFFENSARSVYHSLQARLRKRFSGGFSLDGHWTWSHALDHVSDPFDGRGFFAFSQNSFDLESEWASASFDARHRSTFLLNWEPYARFSRGWLRDLQLAVVGEFQTGQPYTLNTSFDQNGDGNLTDRLNSLNGVVRGEGSRPLQLGGGADLSELLAERGQNGRVGRNTQRADGLATIDVAITRTFMVGDHFRIGARLEVFNLFNSTSFGIPIRIVDSPGFGRSFDTQTGARSIRLGFKAEF